MLPYPKFSLFSNCAVIEVGFFALVAINELSPPPSKKRHRNGSVWVVRVRLSVSLYPPTQRWSLAVTLWREMAIIIGPKQVISERFCETGSSSKMVRGVGRERGVYWVTATIICTRRARQYSIFGCREETGNSCGQWSLGDRENSHTSLSLCMRLAPGGVKSAKINDLIRVRK